MENDLIFVKLFFFFLITLTGSLQDPLRGMQAWMFEYHTDYQL